MSDSTEKSTVPLDEISELLDALMLELRLHGLEMEHELIRRTLAMQEKLKKLD